MGNLIKVFASFTKTQLALLSILGVVALGGIGTGVYLVVDYFAEVETVAEVETETEEIVTQTEEMIAVAEETEKETETETETETEAEAEPILVNLVGSSIEKDLKIKIQDESQNNIKGEEFYISVTPDKKKAKSSIYKDDDHDGIIYIKDIDGGDYLVALSEIEGYYTDKENIKVTVKEKIEYVKVEVKDEIKSEAEVSPSEDAETSKEVVEEAVVQDTVPLLDRNCTSTAISASSLNKDQYITSKVSLGTAVEKILPEGTAVAFRKSITRVGTEGGDPIPGDNTNVITCIITHVFSDGSTSVEQKVEGVAGTVVDVNQYGGYTSDYTGGTTYTITEGVTAFTINWTKIEVTPAEITCIITHTFSDKSETIPQEVKGVAGTVVDVNQYEGYTSDYAGTTYTIKADETAFTINWTKKVTIATAKVSMPETAQLFVSKLDSANHMTLAVTVEDNNETKIVDAAGITWSLKDDTVGGIVLSATTGSSISISTTSGTSKEGTVTAVATVPYKVGTEQKVTTLECVITVKNDTYDASKILTDDANRMLYTDNDCTKVATVADLVEKGVTTFYTDPKYTGWQTLDGKLYYYNSNNQPVTGEQVIGGIKYTFGPDGALTQGASSTGIDVSKWQGNIDWTAVKAAGIEFAIIRVGYRGSQTGVLVEDPYFRQNINGATGAGIKVGIYFFTQAITEAEAVEEASMALSLTQGYNLAYPIFVDSENGSGNARANGLDKATRTACVSAFCKTIQNAGRKAGVYASKSWYNSKLDTSQLNNYCIWVAQYNSECTYTGRYSIWQYTSKGSIPGINGNVDLNRSYM